MSKNQNAPHHRDKAGRPDATVAEPVRTPRQATPYLLALLSAMLLSLAFPPAEIAWLAYLAPVPLLVMAVRTRSPRHVFLAGWLGGTVFFGLNLHWVRPITWAGYFALIPYMGFYWAAFAWLVRRIEGTVRIPLALLAPVLWVPLEALRGWLLTGMPWLLVGHSQHADLLLIQTADLVGVYGTTFLVLATAGLLADLLAHPLILTLEGRRPSTGSGRPERVEGRRVSRVLAAMLLAVAGLWAATIGYGAWRLNQAATRPGPVVTTIQTVIPQSMKNIVKAEQMQTATEIRKEIDRIRQTERQMLDDQFRLTREALDAAATENLKSDLIVWPETMVPGIMNRAFLEYDSRALESYPELARLQERSRGYWEEIRAAAQEAAAPILFGGHSAELRLLRPDVMTFANQENAAFLIAPDTPPYGAEHTYAKAHLVPFGEYVPFKETWPWLNERLRSFTPYGYDYSLSAGRHDQEPFLLRYADRQARFQVAICYEDAMAYRIREMVRPGSAGSPRPDGSPDPAQPKAVDFLINISNDGWFDGSVELDQHLNLCVFRAVENRIPIVRSVNTGISAIITSDGEVVKVVEQNGVRRMVTGYTTARLALDDRVAPYTRHGDVLVWACTAAGGAAAALAVGRGTCLTGRQVRRRKESGP